ncbi:MAG: hypothetical protein Q9179_003862 [Wetmoreana sp. 5 TL-2023]
MASTPAGTGSTIDHTVPHTGQRLKHLLKPDGRRLHVVASPEEHARLHKSLSAVEPEGNFDVCLHGSPEHLATIREIHAHHEERRGQLRKKHASIYDEFEHVHRQLEALSNELHHLAEHGVSLDANFSKFGRSTSDHGQRDWDAERRQGRSLKLWKRPVVRQYLHKGLIWRSSELQEVASFELFVDLLYVGIIAIIGDNAAEDPTGFGLLKFTIVFSIGWKIWSDVQMITSWLETDDIVQRLCIMLVMTCLFGYTLNIVEAFETTYTMMVAFYIWITIFVDIIGQGILILLVRWAQRSKTRIGPLFRKWFEFHPSLNIEHKTERTNAFVTLVFGYSVVALLYQNRAAYGINAFFGKAILGLIQVFFFNWLYFEIDGWNIHTHAIRRHFASSIIWIVIHLPFIMSYVLAGASLSKLVLAHDCRDADPETLTEGYGASSEGEIRPGLRWFYSVGLGVALLCMSIISVCHVHKKFDGQRVTKRSRLVLRIAVAVVIICLPLAESLSSLGLISTTTGLIGLVLVFDLYGCTFVGESFLRDRRKCKYWADCPGSRRRAVDEAMKTGATVNVEELAVDEKGYVPAP